jgi:hypothetical protein
MKAFIEYPEASDDRIEVTGDFYVVTRLRLVDDIIEQVTAKNSGE